jgi:hypothetical protein
MTIKEQIKQRKLLKRDLCKVLDCTMPTLKVKLDNPKRLTLGDVEKLQKIGLNINY